MEERRKYETQISERLAVVESEIKEIKADVRVIYKNIVGNGDGLVESNRIFRKQHENLSTFVVNDFLTTKGWLHGFERFDYIGIDTGEN